MRKLLREVGIATVVGLLLQCHISWDEEIDAVDRENEPRLVAPAPLTEGDFLVTTGAGGCTKLRTGEVGQVLTVSDNVPKWRTLTESELKNGSSVTLEFIPKFHDF